MGCKHCGAQIERSFGISRCSKCRRFVWSWWPGSAGGWILGCGGLIYLWVAVPILWDEHEFNQSSEAEHLTAAKIAQLEAKTEYSVRAGLAHTAAIPSGSPEGAEVAQIAADLQKRLQDMKEDEGNRAQVKQTKIATAPELEAQLRNLGYEVTVSYDTKTPDEIVITAKDLDDTDHRVKFLSIIRSGSGPGRLLCWSGFRTVRLRTGSIPFVSFSEGYSLGC